MRQLQAAPVPLSCGSYPTRTPRAGRRRQGRGERLRVAVTWDSAVSVAMYRKMESNCYAIIGT